MSNRPAGFGCHPRQKPKSKVNWVRLPAEPRKVRSSLSRVRSVGNPIVSFVRASLIRGGMTTKEGGGGESKKIERATEQTVVGLQRELLRSLTSSSRAGHQGPARSWGKGLRKSEDGPGTQGMSNLLGALSRFKKNGRKEIGGRQVGGQTHSRGQSVMGHHSI